MIYIRLVRALSSTTGKLDKWDNDHINDNNVLI